jgi:hypothetical protein
MIKELNELVWYAEKSLWRDEALLAFLCKNKPEVLQLYALIQKHHFKSDEEAAKSIGLCLTTYKKYAKNLKMHLQDMVFFYNEEKARADLRLKNLFEGIKDLGAMRLLYARGCKLASKEVAESLLKKGLLYDWPDFVQQAALYLKECVLRVSGSEKEFDYYANLYQEYKRWSDLENQAWDYVQRVQLPYRRKTGARQIKPEQTRRYVLELQPHVDKAPSIMFHIHYYLLNSQYFLETHNHPALLKNCNAALAYLEQKTYQIQNLQAAFHYMKVIAYTYLGNPQEGEKAAQAGLQFATEGTASWFSALEVYFYFSLHTGNYEKAFELYLQVYTHRRYAALHAAQQELWHILGAYCYILQHLTGTPLPAGFPQFKSGKFLNGIQNYQNDKDGMNIAILIAHFLLQLIEGKDVAVWDRISALAKYRERYLTDDPFVARSEIFIKILVLLVKTGFQRTVFLEKATPLLEALRKLPMQLTNQSHELEIVPYETLTHLIINQLSKRGGLIVRAQQRTHTGAQQWVSL